MRVYSTTLLSVGIGALTFLALGLLFLQPVADWLEYGEHPWYVGMMMIVVAMDAIQAFLSLICAIRNGPSSLQRSNCCSSS